MKDIFKFIGIIIATYAVIMLLLNVSFLEKPFNSIFRQSLESIVKLSFPDAYIETQDFLNAKQKSDPNVFYLVYGNPEVIKAEADYAAKQNLSEYKISSYSSQFYIFQLFTVPLVFLISIFVATPIPFNKKFINLGFSILCFLVFIYFKSYLLTLFSISNSQIGIYQLNDSSMAMLSRIISALTLGLSIILIFCIWLIFGFRNSVFYSQFNLYLKRFNK
ncbi:MAG: hypothetical protein IPO78_10565 [Saprospiraceae bacterium]|nr:hypothetical protein [Saprospiraceae bacterium]MBK8486064.1 hypothetical protein [Saprospiraceae bacterium]MBK9221107.1 hypothetical protein [Saprospiraceae bacterium]MBK9722041.1 hypothetical protein [Saprospiraceae bacterium]MBK9729088.1 hypothetical protein [Saprospiraceae bacterium]